jgi:hypothetical protein
MIVHTFTLRWRRAVLASFAAGVLLTGCENPPLGPTRDGPELDAPGNATGSHANPFRGSSASATPAPVAPHDGQGDAARPLRGRLEGTAQFVPDNGSCGEFELLERDQLSGPLTVFGHALWESVHCNAGTFDRFTFNAGSGTLTAANGDVLQFAFTGGGSIVAFDVETGMVTTRGSGAMTVTGGTGRFSSVTPEVPINFFSGATFPMDALASGGIASVFLELEGAISFDASDRRP